MAHTQGKWEAVNNFITAGTLCATSSFVAECQTGGWIKSDEAKANARLIAAAPELLEALEALASSYVTCLKSKTSDAVWREVAEINLKYILSAIAAAKGGA